MAQAGYSSKSLVDKLGYQAGDTVCCIDAPGWFVSELKNAGITPSYDLPATWLHGFFTNQAKLITFLARTDAKKIKKGFWVSWPKQASGVATDVTEQTFRDLILPLGWVDTKVAAIDEIWSGLKFLRRTH